MIKPSQTAKTFLPIIFPSAPRREFSDSQLHMVIHQDPRCIQIGDCFYNFPDLSRYTEKRITRKEHILHLNKMTPIYDQNLTHKQHAIEQNKRFCELLGPNFNTRFQKVSYSLWVGNDWQLIHRFCRAGKNLSNDLVLRFHYFRSHIDKAIINHEENLIPAILYFCLSISAMSSLLGHRIWTHLCKSKTSRNIALFKILGLYKRGDIVHQYAKLEAPAITCIAPNIAKPILNQLVDFPSGILNSRYVYFELDAACPEIDISNMNTDMLSEPGREYLFLGQLQIFMVIARAAIAAKKITSPLFLRACHQMIIDTRTLALNMNESFNVNWSVNRIRREHKRLTRLQIEKSLRYVSKMPYQFSYPWIKTLEWKGISIKLLDSPYELALEGYELNHCVAIYHDIVFSNKSIIFSLKSVDGYRTTLQLKFTKPNKLKINQHKSFNNIDVSRNEFIAAEKHILSIQNKVLKDLKIPSTDAFYTFNFSTVET